jgi:hypothetical protein
MSLIIQNSVIRSIGTENGLRILLNRKHGCTSLRDSLSNNPNIEEYEQHFSEINNSIDVIVIRHPLEKWISGYIQDLIDYWHPSLRSLFYTGKKTFPIQNWNASSLEYLRLIHSASSTDTDWIFGKGYWGEHLHTNIDRGNEGWSEYGGYLKVQDMIDFLNIRKNVFWIHLNDLSNPKFLSWIKENDPQWNDVECISHKNQSSNLNYDEPNFVVVPNIKLFWKEYYNENIFNEYDLFSPILLKLMFMEPF